MLLSNVVIQIPEAVLVTDGDWRKLNGLIVDNFYIVLTRIPQHILEAINQVVGKQHHHAHKYNKPYHPASLNWKETAALKSVIIESYMTVMFYKAITILYHSIWLNITI